MIPEWKRRKLEAVEKLQELDAGYDIPQEQGKAVENEQGLKRITERDIENFQL